MSKFINLSLLAATAFSRFVFSTPGSKDRAAVNLPVTDTGRGSFFKHPLTALLTSLILAFMLTSCASQPTHLEAIDKRLTVDKPYDEVWGALVRFMGTNQWEFDTGEKESGLMMLSTQFLPKSSIESYCLTDPGMLKDVAGGIVDGSVTVVDGEEEGTVIVNTRLYFRYSTETSIAGRLASAAYETAAIGGAASGRSILPQLGSSSSNSIGTAVLAAGAAGSTFANLSKSQMKPCVTTGELETLILDSVK